MVVTAEKVRRSVSFCHVCKPRIDGRHAGKIRAVTESVFFGNHVPPLLILHTYRFDRFIHLRLGKMRKHHRRHDRSAVCLRNAPHHPFIPGYLFIPNINFIVAVCIFVISAVIQKEQGLVQITVTRNIHGVVAHSVKIGRPALEQAIFSLFIPVRLPG